MILEGFESGVDVEMKQDNTPVTEVDKAINRLIGDSIVARFPDHGLLGEEEDFGNGSEEYQWLCDPLDGTQCFILGIPHSTCILGLLKGGEVQLAVVYNPYTDRLYHAVRGQGAYVNDQPIRVNSQPLKGGYLLAENSTQQFAPQLHATGVKFEPINACGYTFMLIATGKASATVKGKFDFHDSGVASLIVEEAGGRVTALDGSPLSFAQQGQGGMIVSNGVCHDELVLALKA